MCVGFNLWSLNWHRSLSSVQVYTRGSTAVSFNHLLWRCRSLWILLNSQVWNLFLIVVLNHRAPIPPFLLLWPVCVSLLMRGLLVKFLCHLLLHLLVSCVVEQGLAARIFLNWILSTAVLLGILLIIEQAWFWALLSIRWRAVSARIEIDWAVVAAWRLLHVFARAWNNDLRGVLVLVLLPFKESWALRRNAPVSVRHGSFRCCHEVNFLLLFLLSVTAANLMMVLVDAIEDARRRRIRRILRALQFLECACFRCEFVVGFVGGVDHLDRILIRSKILRFQCWIFRWSGFILGRLAGIGRCWFLSDRFLRWSLWFGRIMFDDGLSFCVNWWCDCWLTLPGTGRVRVQGLRLQLLLLLYWKLVQIKFK